MYIHKNYELEHYEIEYMNMQYEIIWISSRISNYKIHLYVRVCEANVYMHMHLELVIMVEYYAL